MLDHLNSPEQVAGAACDMADAMEADAAASKAVGQPQPAATGVPSHEPVKQEGREEEPAALPAQQCQDFSAAAEAVGLAVKGNPDAAMSEAPKKLLDLYQT